MEQGTAARTADELVAFARLSDFKITADQLRRWHLAGALPRPTQVSLGRPHGTVTLYPQETANQLIRLCELHRREKRLGHVTWALWWEGYRVETFRAREFLRTAAVELDQSIAKVRWLLQDNGVANALFDKSISARISHALVRQVRKRVGSQRFPQLMDLILRVAIGSFTGFAPFSEEREVFEKGLALDRAQADRMYTAPPWLKDPEEPLVRLSALLKDASFASALNVATDAELEEARAELRRFFTLMEGFSDAASRRFGPNSFGMVLIGAGQKVLRIEDYARQCLLWIHIRRSAEMRQGMGEIISAGSAADSMSRCSAAIDVLTAEVPALAPLMAPKKMRAAARSAAAHARHLQELRAGYDANRDAIEEFKKRHPDLLIE